MIYERYKTLSPEALDRGALAVEALDGEAVFVGGYAMQLYGSPRLTGDLDVLVHVQQLPAEVLRVATPLAFVGGVAAEVDGVDVDFLDRDSDELYNEAAVNTQRVNGHRLAHPEHLLALKLLARRAKDVADIAWLAEQPFLDHALALDIVRRHLGRGYERDLRQDLEIAAWRRSRR